MEVLSLMDSMHIRIICHPIILIYYTGKYICSRTYLFEYITVTLSRLQSTRLLLYVMFSLLPKYHDMKTTRFTILWLVIHRVHPSSTIDTMSGAWSSPNMEKVTEVGVQTALPTISDFLKPLDIFLHSNAACEEYIEECKQKCTQDYVYAEQCAGGCVCDVACVRYEYCCPNFNTICPSLYKRELERLHRSMENFGEVGKVDCLNVSGIKHKLLSSRHTSSVDLRLIHLYMNFLW